MMKGQAAPLLSSFKLTYYTVLNLLRRVEDHGARRPLRVRLSAAFCSMVAALPFFCKLNRPPFGPPLLDPLSCHPPSPAATMEFVISKSFSQVGPSSRQHPQSWAWRLRPAGSALRQSAQTSNLASSTHTCARCPPPLPLTCSSSTSSSCPSWRAG